LDEEKRCKDKYKEKKEKEKTYEINENK